MVSSVRTRLQKMRGSHKGPALLSVGIEREVEFVGSSADSIKLSGIIGTNCGLRFVAAGEFTSIGQWVVGATSKLTRSQSGKLDEFQLPVSGRLYVHDSLLFTIPVIILSS